MGRLSINNNIPSSGSLSGVLPAFSLLLLSLLLLDSNNFLTVITSAQDFGGGCGKTPIFNWGNSAENAFGCSLSHRDTNVWKPPANSSCRFSPPSWSSRMSEGEPAKLGEFPSFVRLQCRSKSASIECGGVLIRPDLVMTANHCVIPGSTTCMLRAGLVDENDKRNMQARRAVVACKLPGHFFSADGAFNDLALLRPNKPFELNKYVQTACLASNQAHNANAECYGVGMGYTRNQGRMNDELLVLPMKRRPCDSFTGYQRVPGGERGRSCYITSRGSGNPCEGDSGSPMYCFSKCAGGEPKQTVVGVVSFGARDACIPKRTIPVVYTDIHKLGNTYRSFESECMKKHEGDGFDDGHWVVRFGELEQRRRINSTTDDLDLDADDSR